jgi:hypothetical protein
MSEEAIGSHRPHGTDGRMVTSAPFAEPEAQEPGLVTHVRELWGQCLLPGPAYPKSGNRKCGSLDVSTLWAIFLIILLFFSLHQKIKLIDMKFV